MGNRGNMAERAGTRKRAVLNRTLGSAISLRIKDRRLGLFRSFICLTPIEQNQNSV